jgi:hypothetical protein
MSRKPSHAIRTLVRWRAFQEALAERECQQASLRVVEAQNVVNEAQAVVDAIERRRDELLAERIIDLGLMSEIAGFEQRAWDVVRIRTDAHDEAMHAREQALAAHLQTRTRTRVAEARCDRVVALENDQDEKRMFDRMASLIAAGTKEARHD